MRFFLKYTSLIMLGLFVGCNSSTEEKPSSQKKVVDPQPVLIAGKNIFNTQNGSLECFHDRASDKEFDIACHLYVTHEDGTKSLADFLSKELEASWLPPVAGENVSVSSLNCIVVHGNLGYRCHLITADMISLGELSEKYYFSFQAVDKQNKVELKMAAFVSLPDKNDSIPPELDSILIEESVGELTPEGLSLVSGNQSITTPFGEAKGVGLMTVRKVTQQATPTPVTVVDPVWFDNLDEEGNEKISLQCKQVESTLPEVNGEVSFAIRCELVVSEELKNTLQLSDSKLEGYSFPEGGKTNRLSCSQNANGYLCLGAVLKENLEMPQNEKPFARVELRLARQNEYRLFTRTTALAFSRNSVQ